MIKRIIKIFFFTLLLILLFFILTQPGLQLGVKILEKTIPGNLQIETTHGELVRKIDLKNVHYEKGALKIDINKVNFSWNALYLLIGHVKINELYVNDAWVRLPDQPESKKQTEITAHHPSLMPLFALTVANLKLENITIQKGEKKHHLKLLQLAGSTKQENITLENLLVESDFYTFKLHGSTQLKLPFNSNLNGELINRSPGFYPIVSVFKLNGDLVNQLVFHYDTDKPFSAHLTATLIHGIKEGGITVHGKWKNVLLPIGAISNITSNNGQIDVLGTLKNYRLKLNSNIGGLNIPFGDWKIEGTGSLDSLNLTSISAQTLEGTINGFIQLAWKPYLSWKTNLTLQHINPGSKWVDFIGDINVILKSQADYNIKHPYFSLNIDNLNGSLHGNPINGKLDLMKRRNDLDIPNLDFTLGDNNITAKGTLTNRWNINWQINAPRLPEIWPRATGIIQGKGSITGREKRPNITLNLLIRNLFIEKIHITALDANGNINLEKYGLFNGELSLHNLYFGSQGINKLSINTHGTAHRHIINAQLKIKDAVINTQAIGHYTDPEWQATIQKISVTSKKYLPWQLQAPFRIMLSTETKKIEPFCLATQHSKFCGSGHWSNIIDWDLQLMGTYLPTTLLNQFLPNQVHIDTHLNLQANLKSSIEQKPLGDIRLSTGPGSVTNEINHSIQFSKISWNLNASKKELSSDLKIEQAQTALLDAQFTLPDYYSPISLPHQPIKGHLITNIPHLSFLPMIIPDITHSDGSLYTNLTLNGSLPIPSLTGNLSLKEGSVNVTPLNLLFSNIQLNAHATNTDTVILTGSIQSEKNTLALKGTLDFSKDIPTLILTATGENLLAINTDEYRVRISPKLKLNYSAPNMTLSGDLAIPEAKITPTDFTTTVTLPNTVIMTGSDATTNPFKKLDFYANLNITLGDNIIFAYDGLAVKLNGSLALKSSPRELTTATGALNITDGYFKAYSTNLEIEQGRLVYTGGPVDDPGLDIRAVKRLQQASEAAPRITTTNTGALTSLTETPRLVGVTVTGTLRHHEVTLFSEPSGFKESDILSYLVLGSPTNTASSAQGKLLLQTAKSMNLGGGSNIYDDITSALGLSEFGIENEMIADPKDNTLEENPSFVVGKYIAPKLYLSYGVGLVVPINILRLRYYLSRRVSAQSETSTLGTGADLFYTFQTN